MSQAFTMCTSCLLYTSSSVYGSDYQAEFTVYNKWINEDINIESEVLEDGSLRYRGSFIAQGVYCRVIGIMSKEEFINIVERIIT